MATGFVVLIGTAAAGERLRIYDSAILKTLGAERHRILSYLAIRFMMLGLAAGLFAVLAGGAVGWAVITRIMQLEYEFDLSSAAVTVAGGAAIALVAGLFFALKPLRAAPARVLRQRD